MTDIYTGRKAYKIHMSHGDNRSYVQEYTCTDGAEMIIGSVLFWGKWQECRDYLDDLLTKGVSNEQSAQERVGRNPKPD
jgi:hypothetical protein